MLEELEASSEDLLTIFVSAIRDWEEHEPLPYKNEVEALLAKYYEN